MNKQLEFVIAKTIAGFMNTNGGKLLIGVDITATSSV
ncbi:putative DNA binding domain-containing protein [Winogradskyella maritima]|nr:putative DNA binding domain-containing protein [Winogradskyella maritima]